MKFMKRFCSLERTDYCDEHPLFFTEEASVLFVSCTGAYLALFQFVRGERDGRELAWRLFLPVRQSKSDSKMG